MFSFIEENGGLLIIFKIFIKCINLNATGTVRLENKPPAKEIPQREKLLRLISFDTLIHIVYLPILVL